MNHQNERLIGKGFSYGSQLEEGNVSSRQTCITRYKQHIQTARQLATEHKLFLDANVLLGYYQMPWEARQKLYDFLEKNKHRVYICDQVQREFSKHRETVINEYYAKIVLDGPTDRQKNVSVSIDDFLELNEDVLGAYPDFATALKGVHKNTFAILEKLKDLAKERAQKCKEHLQKQDILTLMSQFHQLPSLGATELEFAKDEFEQFRAVAESFGSGGPIASIEAYLYKHPNKVFPGVSDIKSKPKTPYGDYYIFHEMMKWIASNPQEVPIIFLTNDVAKNDWVDSAKRAYTHYLETMHLNTGDVFYALHAEEIFTTLFEVPAAHLVISDDIIEDIEAATTADRKKSKVDALTSKSIQDLLQDLFPNREFADEEEDFWLALIDDLEHDFDIVSLFDLKILLLENYHLLVQSELERFGVSDQLDALEVILELVFEE